MKACRVHRFGGPDVIQVEDMPLPEPGPGEARVRVRASGVGPWDVWIRSGKSAVPQSLPLTLGVDVAGEIEALGEGTTGFRVGEAVFGATNARFTGANAEFAVASVARFARKPAGASFAEAGGAPVVAITAWRALFEKAKLTPGDTVLNPRRSRERWRFRGAARPVGSRQSSCDTRPG